MEKNTQAKRLVYALYNLVNQHADGEYNDILGVLLKVYKKLDKVKDPAPLINRLVNYLYFTGFTKRLAFADAELEIIKALGDIGKTAGNNGVYRSDYGNHDQF
ncbi:MAG: bacteriocin immunity protein [Lactobacillaceae bacterium]|nr:bacteriocin immunity protein [Lactobacillaceae bacterium]